MCQIKHVLKLLANLLWSGIRKYTDNSQLPFLLFHLFFFLFIFFFGDWKDKWSQSINQYLHFQTKKVVRVFLLFQSSWQCIQNFINRNESNLQNEVKRNRSEAGLHWSIFAFYWYRIRLMENFIFINTDMDLTVYLIKRVQVDVILSCDVQCFHCHFPKLQKKNKCRYSRTTKINTNIFFK